MIKTITILLVLVFVGCGNDSTLIMKDKNQKCVVDSVVYVGQRSTIETGIYWDIYTNCGIKLQVKQPCRCVKGDTIIFEKFYETRDF